MLLKSIALASDAATKTMTVTLEMPDGSKFQIVGETNFESTDIPTQLTAMLTILNRYVDAKTLLAGGKIVEIAKP